MVQTRAQSKTTASSATEKPAVGRTAKSATASTASKAKPKTAKKEESKPVEEENDVKPSQPRTTQKKEDIKPEPKPRKKAEPKTESKSKPTPPETTTIGSNTKSRSGTRTIIVDAPSKRVVAAKKAADDQLKKSARAEPKKTTAIAPKKASVAEPEKIAPTTSRLGKPIKPKNKPITTIKNDKLATKQVAQPAVNEVERAESVDAEVRVVLPPKQLVEETIAQVNDQSSDGLCLDKDLLKQIEAHSSIPIAPGSVFKSSTLSPTKTLGSPIKAPFSIRSVKPNRVLESPKRGTPSLQASIRRDLTTSLLMSQNVESVINPASSQMTIGLSPFKSIGTPVRRPFTSSLFSSSKVSSTAMPAKRFAMDSPWRPMSVRAEKRTRLDATPRRPRTADDVFAPSSCMKTAPRLMSSKKTVSFQSPGSNDGSPNSRKHENKFGLAPLLLPRLSEGHESELAEETPVEQELESSPEVEAEPLALSEVLNMEFSPDSSPKATTPPTILKEVIFYVDVCGSDGSNVNQYFIPLLEELGAKVTDIWTDDITHVLFKDGDSKTLTRVAKTRGAVKCVNVGWPLDCERYKCHMAEDAYQVVLGAEPSTPATALRTPLRPLDSNRPSPTPARTISKTPGTVLFDAKIQAIRDARIKTPDFSSFQVDIDSIESPDVQTTPLMLKSCPPKQANKPFHTTDESVEIRKKLFKGARKSLGAALMMKWVDEDDD